ncbi:DUF6544 family protein [Jiella marina]|uniref:DUF6544 family protein n=1 Tax=Jiella sp. LLJ827 TaxID=2917712 RepID=UPI0021014C9E|nr:DUF6544 family protein [Jiella sp. LLJ827]MCQ0987189.1 hypothetical protein [Jiella sp. LLJ827]
MLIEILLILLGALIAAVAGLVALRIRDARADQTLRQDLLRHATGAAPRFEEAMLLDLPEPAARFFRFVIRPGTELKFVAVIRMSGTLALGSGGTPTEQPMTAEQVLAPPYGLLWQVRIKSALRTTGSDAMNSAISWSRFRLFDVVPVARVAKNPDHFHSAFGRMVGEGLFWTPAAFLPATHAGWDGLAWEATGTNSAAVTVRLGQLEQRAEIAIEDDGRPTSVIFQRWSNENANKVFRLQPFGGDLTEFRDFDGYRLPTRVIGGNHYGTDLYRPFYKAEVETIRFP